jgi:hypothetical protein
MTLAIDPSLLTQNGSQGDPTQDLQNQADASRLALVNAIQNQTQDNSQPAPQQQPQPDPSQQQQAPAQNASGGPVKSGLRGVLLQIIRNVGMGGLPAAAYPGDLMGEAHQRNQVAVQEAQARTGEYQAQTKELTAEATQRTAQAKPRLLIDPQSGGPAFGPDGTVRTGTLDDQKELNDLWKTTGGYVNVPDAVAASIGMPDLAGKQMPANTFNTIMSSQNSKTIESEIARLSQFELSKGRDPNQSPDVQSLIAIRRHMQNVTPDQYDEQYRELYAKAHSGGKLSTGEQAWMQGYEHQKVLVPQARMQLQLNGGGLIPQGGQQGTTATIDQVKPEIRPQVQAILDYRQPMPPMGRNNPTNQALQYWVNAIDPTYDATTFPARNSILKSYTSGPEAKSINAINTALGHLGELGEAAKLVNQNNIPALHSLAAKLGVASGDDAATTYTNILHRVSPELTTAYLSSGGGEAERGANESDFDISKGADQITSNIAESAKLLRSKINAQQQQWNDTFRPTRPQDQFENRFITPQAKATLDQFSAQAPTSKAAAANALTVTDPRGGIHKFRDQSSADAFKKAAGIQ